MSSFFSLKRSSYFSKRENLSIEVAWWSNRRNHDEIFGLFAAFASAQRDSCLMTVRKYRTLVFLLRFLEMESWNEVSNILTRGMISKESLSNWNTFRIYIYICEISSRIVYYTLSRSREINCIFTLKRPLTCISKIFWNKNWLETRAKIFYFAWSLKINIFDPSQHSWIG